MLSVGLRYFLRVAQHGSIRGAADQLRIAQSAVSRQIQNLEAEMRIKLFERSARGVRLTSAGEILLYHARETAFQGERLRADIEAIRGVRRGHVILRTIESFAASQLPEVLAQFCSRHPAVTLDVNVSRTAAIVDQLHDGACHLGIVFGISRYPDLVTLASMAEPMQVVVSVNHPLARSKQLTLSDLLAYPIAAPTAFGGSRAIFDAAWEEAGLSYTPMIVTNSMHVLAGFLAAGEGVSITALSRAQIYVDSGMLTVIPIAGAALTRGRVELLMRKGQKLPPAGEALARAVGRSFANLDARA